MKTTILTICCALLAVQALCAGQAAAGPLWAYVVNEQEKLYGGIVVGDERGTYWHGELPPGWEKIDLKESLALGSDPAYVDLSQIYVIGRGENVKIEISRHNLGKSLQRSNVPQQEIDARIARVEALPCVHLR